MARVKQWVEKSKKNSLQPNEHVIVALGVAVQDKVKDSAAGALFGLSGSIPTAIKHKAKEEKARNATTSKLAQEYPKGPVIVAYTNKRILVYKLNWRGRPSELAVSYDPSDIRDAKAVNKRLNYALTLTFADGGSVTNDVSLAQKKALDQFSKLVNEKTHTIHDLSSIKN